MGDQASTRRPGVLPWGERAGRGHGAGRLAGGCPVRVAPAVPCPGRPGLPDRWACSGSVAGRSGLCSRALRRSVAERGQAGGEGGEGAVQGGQERRAERREGWLLLAELGDGGRGPGGRVEAAGEPGGEVGELDGLVGGEARMRLGDRLAESAGELERGLLEGAGRGEGDV